MHDILRSLPLFGALDDAMLTRLSTDGEMLYFAPGDLLVVAGEAGDAVWVLVEGAWTVRRQGGPQPLERQVSTPGAWLGGVMLLERTAPLEIEAVAECTAFTVPRDVFEDAAAGSETLAAAILAGLHEEVRALQAHRAPPPPKAPVKAPRKTTAKPRRTSAATTRSAPEGEARD